MLYSLLFRAARAFAIRGDTDADTVHRCDSQGDALQSLGRPGNHATPLRGTRWSCKGRRAGR